MCQYVVKNGYVYRIFTDHLGSPRLVMDANTSQVVQRLDFAVFGEVVQDSAPGWQPFGFAGGIYDPQTGLLRLGARDYDPSTGRFISKDPIGFSAADTNLFAYVSGDPVNYTDVTGLTKGGKQNKSVTHRGVELTANSGAKVIAEAVADAEATGMSTAHIKALRGIQKIAKSTERYANKFGRAKGIIGQVVGLALGLFEDYDRYTRAKENGISYEEQLHRDLQDAGDYIETPLGLIPNICKLKST